MITRKLSALFIVFSACALMLLSCATQPVVEEKKPEPEAPRLTKEEQEQRSTVAYNDIVEMTFDVNVKRRDIIPQLKEKYLDLIRDYPDSYFAEESHLRLIMMSFQDYDPPQVEEAEKYYRKYFKDYPNPKLGNAINDTMARDYYRYGYWKKLEDFLAPQVEKYVKTGEVPKPFYFFMYVEAMFYLKDYVEAEKGYQALVRLFPGSHEAKLSEVKLKMIEDLKAGGEEKK